MADAVKHRARVHQLDCIVAFLQEKVKNRIFLKLDSKYTDYFPEYSTYLGRALILLKYIYGMTNSGKLFYNELTEWLLEAGFIKSYCQMYICYKYAPDGGKLLFFYFYDCVYCYTSKDLGKCFVGSIGNRFHMNFFGYAHFYVSQEFFRWRIILFLYIKLDMPLLLLNNTRILSQLRQVQSLQD